MKYYIVAGEASGDLHGANLIRALKQIDTQAVFRCWGGDLMIQATGNQMIKHYRDLAFMGFVEVVKNLRTILNNLKFCEKDILQFQPDVLILIDYPGFNLRMAAFAKKQGIRVFYYISPQVWAWHTSRVTKMKKNIDRLFVILPFEQDFFAQWNWQVDFVGHPLLDAIEQAQKNVDLIVTKKGILNIQKDKPIIALLPGSRKQEIRRMLPIMLQVANFFLDYQFVVAGVETMPPNFYENILNDKKITNTSIFLVKNKTYELLQIAEVALVSSGTATLETALFNVPQIVCYKGNILSYHLAKYLVGKRVKYISLVNLILDKPAVLELIQYDFTVTNLKTALAKLLNTSNNTNHRKAIQTAYAELRHKLGGTGASQRVARLMQKYLQIASNEL